MIFILKLSLLRGHFTHPGGGGARVFLARAGEKGYKYRAMDSSEWHNRSLKILKEFEGLHSWEDRYRKIIEMGRSGPVLDPQYKTRDRLVKGCQSQVWLYAFQNKGGEVIFLSDSDALITRGLAALMVRFYSGLPARDIMESGEPFFLKKLDLANHLTPTRVGGLLSLINQIRYYARAFWLLSQKKP